jgi:hypothetical protein
MKTIVRLRSPSFIKKEPVQAGQAKRRKNDGSLYLEAMDLTLRETSQLGSVSSSERPKKITATKELVLPENQLVKKKAMALQA